MKDPRPYVSEVHDLAGLAPQFRARVEEVRANMLRQGFDPLVYETTRIERRQWWIYGTGRSAEQCVDHGVPAEFAWQGADGTTTNAASYLASVHGHGLAVDIISRRKLWDASAAFWTALGKAVQAQHLTWGGTWKTPHDVPHFQWQLSRGGVVFAGPSAEDRERTRVHGMHATWEYYKAA